MKRTLYLIAIFALTSVLFSGCKKWFDKPDSPESKEDLSYLYKTYEFNTSNNKTYKTIRFYDGYKMTGLKYYVDGQLSSEYKNYFYDGLNSSWDYYSYNNNDTNDVNYRSHGECEYLDETYLRIKYQRKQYYYQDSQDNCIYETYREYDGKKWVGYKYYKNGVLLREGFDCKCPFNSADSVLESAELKLFPLWFSVLLFRILTVATVATVAKPPNRSLIPL